MFDKYRVTNCKKLIESSMINESQEKRQPSSPLARRKTCRKAEKRKKLTASGHIHHQGAFVYVCEFHF